MIARECQNGTAGIAPSKKMAVAMNANVTRVLLVDDHVLVREGLRALLQSHLDYMVIGEAVNGRDALEKAGRLKPDVVVMDITMPELDGLETLRRLAVLSPTTKVLILTMHDSNYLAREALRAGARGYLLKSDGGRDLLQALESLRENKPFLTPKIAEIVLNGLRESGEQNREARKLTDREMEVLKFLAEGKSSKEIATRLNISFKTAETHRANLMSKLGAHSVAQIVRYAVRQRMIEP